MRNEDPSHPIDGSGDEMMLEILKSVRSIDQRLASLEAKLDELDMLEDRFLEGLIEKLDPEHTGPLLPQP